MTDMTPPTRTSTTGTTSRPRSSQTGATQSRSVSSKRDTSLGWKSMILSAGVGATLLGSAMFTQIEQANAAADAARTNQAAAVVQVVQALETAQNSRTAQLVAQANAANQPRTVIVRVPVMTDGGQQVVNQVGGQQPSGQPPAQPGFLQQRTGPGSGPGPRHRHARHAGCADLSSTGHRHPQVLRNETNLPISQSPNLDTRLRDWEIGRLAERKRPSCYTNIVFEP